MLNLQFVYFEKNLASVSRLLILGPLKKRTKIKGLSTETIFFSAESLLDFPPNNDELQSPRSALFLPYPNKLYLDTLPLQFAMENSRTLRKDLRDLRALQPA